MSAWVPVQYSTWDKPQLARLARLAGISKSHALGCLVRLWSLADQQATDGVLDWSPADMDAELGVVGFCAAAADSRVGWLVIEGDGHSIRCPKLDRYCGSGAKAALLHRRRAKASRDRDGMDAGGSAGAAGRALDGSAGCAVGGAGCAAERSGGAPKRTKGAPGRTADAPERTYVRTDGRTHSRPSVRTDGAGGPPAVASGRRSAGGSGYDRVAPEGPSVASDGEDLMTYAEAVSRFGGLMDGMRASNGKAGEA